MKTIITHENFDLEYEKLLGNQCVFYVPTYTKITKITQKHAAKWELSKIPIIRKSTDAKGFRMGSGPKSVYILPGQLISYSIK